MNASMWPDRHRAIMNRPDSRKLRTLIVSLNARFEHENPAAWYLKAACDRRGPGLCGEVAVLSGTINEDLIRIFGSVAGFSPDVAAFSCYVWNRDDTLRLCADLRSAFPWLVIVAGGPEVTHGDGGDEYRTAGADLILAGEGEACFPDLLESLSGGIWPDADAVARYGRISAPLEPEKLVSPCSPEYLALLGGRIAYIESSRGCPYGCSYCLSSESMGMTKIPLERVYHELELLVAAGVKVVKFTDRTFNLSEERTLDIWNHIGRYRENGIVFHFEVAPDRLSAAQISLLGALPPGLVQIEAGIQSTHPGTLVLIGRGMDVESALDRLRQVIAKGNVHVHADLIAGLPGEGCMQFAASFDRLAAIRPHHLQLGFLKLLRGTRLEREARKWGYVRRGYAPYEVIASSALSPAEMLRLKDVEETLERFANSGRFLLVMQWLLTRFNSAFALHEKLADKQRQMGMLGRAVSSEALFRCMHAFLSEGIPAAGEGETASDGKSASAFSGIGISLLRLDWVCAHRNPFLPEWLSDGTSRMTAGNEWLHEAYGAGDDGGNGTGCRKRVDGGEGMAGRTDVRMGNEKKTAALNPNARDRRNRYYAAVGVLPPEVRDGVRYITVNKGAGSEESGNEETGNVETGNVETGNMETGNMETGNARFHILIDVRKSNPVLGRPDVTVMPF